MKGLLQIASENFTSRVSNLKLNGFSSSLLPRETGKDFFTLTIFIFLLSNSFISGAQRNSLFRGIIERGRVLALIILFIGIGMTADAQWMLINKDGGTPDSTAALEIRDTTRGVLFPRLTASQMNGITPNKAGLIIYNTDSNAIYFNNGLGWASIGTSSSASTDTLDENVFSAKISNNGTAAIVSENQNFISTVTRTQQGSVSIVFKSGFFTVAPSILATRVGGFNDFCAVASISTTGFTVHSDDVINPGVDSDFFVLVQRQGSDYKYNIGGGSGSSTSSSADDTTANIPVGSILSFAGDSSKIPAGFLLCNGTSLSQSSYSELFTAIGKAWGGNAANFNLPDLRGRFLRGTDYGATNDPDRAIRTAITTGGNTGDKVGSLQVDDFKSHDHDGYSNLNLSYAGGGGRVNDAPNGRATGGRYWSTLNTGGNETRPKNANVNYIICYSSSIAAAGTNSSVFQGAISSSQLPASAFEDSTRITDADGTAKVKVDGSDNILFTTNSSEAMRLNSSGLLGIGTTSMDSTLTVAGGINAENIRLSYRGGANKILTSDALGNAAWQTPASSPWTVSGSDVYRSTGKVGIGTSSPLAPLHVQSNVPYSISLKRTGSNADSNGIAFQNTGGFYTWNIYQDENENLRFRSHSANATIGGLLEKFTILNGGNVGIGEASPISTLHVGGITTIDQASTSTEGFVIRRSNDQSKIFRIFTGTGKNGNLSLNNATGSVKVLLSSGTDDSYVNSGDFGVGLTNPASKFHVIGTGTFDQPATSGVGIQIRRDDDNSKVAEFYTGSSKNANVSLYNSAGVEKIKLATGLFDSYFNGGGNFGIGTTSPSTKLHVIGTAAVSLTSDGYFMSGVKTGPNIVMDNNEILARSNGAISPLYLQNAGGDLSVGNNKLYVTHAGLVGIGLTAPQAKFHVSGGSMLLDNTYSLNGEHTAGTAHNLIKVNSSNNVVIGSTSFNDLRFNAGTGGANALTIKSGGNVGIGTTNPNHKLEVNGGIDADTITVVEANSPATGTANLLPIAYGRVAPSGGNTGGTGNYTISNPSTGKYIITITGVAVVSQATCVAMVVPEANSNGRTATYEFTGSTLEVYMWQGNTNAAVANAFSFVLFKH